MSTVLLVIQMLLGFTLLISGLMKLMILLLNYLTVNIPPARGFFRVALNDKRQKIALLVTGTIYLLVSAGLLIPIAISTWPIVPAVAAFSLVFLMPVTVAIEGKKLLSIYLDIIILLMAVFVGYASFFL